MPDRIETFRAMVARQPENALARFGFANELLKANRLDEAVTELSAYLERHDDEGNGWLRYAEALGQLGRVEEARVAIARGIANAQRYRHATLVAELEALAEEL